MFIGHYAVAFLIIVLFPQAPVWLPLLCVAFPDLLWGVLVLANKEEVTVDRGSPLQTARVFKKYPYSHSLVLGGVISLVAGTLLAFILGNLLVAPIFILASLSHWILDTVVHLHDLPVLGFDRDRKVGLGLWRWGAAAFLVELVLFSVAAILWVKGSGLFPTLAVGLTFHAINANSFLGFSKSNPLGSSRAFALSALVGFAALTAIFASVL